MREEVGHDYCGRLASTADNVSQKELGVGIAATVLGGGAAIAGTAMGPGSSTDNWAARNRNTLVLGGGAALGLLGTLLVQRGMDASNASASASTALGQADGEAAMVDCLSARSVWVLGRGEAASGALATYRQDIVALKGRVVTEAKVNASVLRDAADAAKAASSASAAELEAKAKEAEYRLKALTAEMVTPVPVPTQPPSAP